MQPVYITKWCSIEGDNLTIDGKTAELDYKQIIADAALRRRMSRIVKMGVSCGLICLDRADARPVSAIITATGLGCLTDTEKFLDSIITNNERLLNPTPFIQSTFNTIGGQIALLRGIHSYNVTYVHRGLSFQSALIDAAMQVADDGTNVLLGAVDEATNSSINIQRRLRMTRFFEIGEGASFFVLNSHPATKNNVAIADVAMQIGKLSAADTAKWISSFIASNVLDNKKLHIELLCNPYLRNALEETLGTNSNLLIKQSDYPTYSATSMSKVCDLFQKPDNQFESVILFNEYQEDNYSIILLKKQVQ